MACRGLCPASLLLLRRRLGLLLFLKVLCLRRRLDLLLFLCRLILLLLFLLWLLLLFASLRVNGSNGSGKQKQNCCSEMCEWKPGGHRQNTSASFGHVTSFGL